MLNIALTNLRKYNEGRLVYKWVKLPATEEEIKAAMKAIGINKEYEEYFITDYETDIDGLTVDEHESLNDLNELAERYENLDEHEQAVVKAYMEYYGDLGDALETIENGDYQFYPDKDLEEVAEQLVDEGWFGDTKRMGNLANYIDYERLGRDLGFEGYHETKHGVIYCYGK